MRLLRFRFTVRGMMASVVLAALILFAAPRLYGYVLLRQLWSMRAEEEADHVSFYESCVPPLVEQTTYHRAMQRKYEHAARYPWLPIEPDPPEPR